MATLFRKNSYDALQSRLSEESEDLKERQFAGPSYERKYRRSRVLNLCLTVALVLTVSYTLYMRVHGHSGPSNSIELPLGVDPFGYVPPDIGQPLQWTSFDKNDPYYIEYDVFDSVESAEKAVQKLFDLDNPGILTHGKNTTYVHSDGQIRKLRPKIAYQGENKFPVYFLRGFHQMHCITILLDDHGHRAHGVESYWESEHIAHCLNILREAVSCLADSSVSSFTYAGDHHIARDQQSYCRNYKALREWADDPVRAARYENVLQD